MRKEVAEIKSDEDALQQVIQSGLIFRSQIASITNRLRQLENQRQRTADVSAGRAPKFIGLADAWEKQN